MDSGDADKTPVWKFELGMQSMDYIAAAQAMLNQGDVGGCIRLIKQGVEAGAQPAALLLQAHQNALDGQKKLMALPSAKKNIQSKPVSGERKVSNSSVESSRVYQHLKKRKKINWAPPVRAVRSTPSRTEMPILNIKKLEESPLPSSIVLDSPSPAKPSLLSSYIKLEETNTSISDVEDVNLKSIVSSKSGSPEESSSQGKNERNCLNSCQDENAISSIKEDELQHNQAKQELAGVKKGGKAMDMIIRESAKISLSESLLLNKSDCVADGLSRSNTSATLHASLNHGKFFQNSLVKDTEQNSKSALVLAGSEKSIQKISKTAPITAGSQESQESTEKSTTRSPDTLLGTELLSGSTNDRFSYHTDSNFFSEKFRCSSDSGYQEVPLKSTTPFTLPVASNRTAPNGRNQINLTSDLGKEGHDVKNVATTEDGPPLHCGNISGIVELVKTSPPREEYAAKQKVITTQDSFKKPIAPVIKISQIDRKTEAKSSTQSRDASTMVNSSTLKQPVCPDVMATDLSDYLMQRKHAAKARSTSKKHKIIRIKNEKYKYIRELGKGGYGKVYEVENEDGKSVAMKCVRLDYLDDVVFQSHINEIEILRKLRNEPCIITLHDYELKNETLFMLMEKGEMDLEKYIRLNNKLADEQIRKLWIQMLSAVSSIHKQGIIHMDLKPPNFLFVDSALKLIDFGIAKGLQDNCTSTQRDCMMGTLNYMAPESVSESTYDGSKKNYKIRRATDIWSLGCILYLMVYGKTPFQHITNRAIKMVEITEGRDIAFPDLPNKSLTDTMKGCLKRNPAQRYTIDQLLAHPFVTGKESPLNEDDKENNLEFLDKRDLQAFIQDVEKSSFNSPKSLKRIQNTWTKRALAESNTINPVRKAIF